MTNTKPGHPVADDKARFTGRVRGFFKQGDRDMGKKLLMRLTAFATAMALVVLGAGVAFADELENDVRSNHAGREITRGGYLDVSYWIVKKNNDDINGCNASASTPALISINPPSGVTSSLSQLSFTACGNETTNAQTVRFTASSTAVLGNHPIGHSDPSGYETLSADFVLRVIPRVPSAASATATSSTQIDVSWTRSADHTDLTQYLVERSTDGTTWGDAVSVTPNPSTGTTDSYSDATVSANTQYFYRVRAQVWNSNPHDQNNHFRSAYTTSPGLTTPGGGSTDAAPTVDAGADVTGAEGSNISLDATVTDDAVSSLTTEWTYSAGVGVDAGATCAFGNAADIDTTVNCTDDGTYTVTLSADDLGNAPVTDTATVTVTNAVPVVATFTPTATSACAVSVSTTFTDAGSNDTHTTSIDWGDNTTDHEDSTGASPIASSHTYQTAGTFTVTATAVDDDNGSGFNTGNFTTMNTPSGVLQPINAAGTSNFKIGSTIPVKITVTDCGNAAVSTLSPVVSLAKTGTGGGDVNEVISSSAADTGRTMRWSPDGPHYIYNLSTKRSQFCLAPALTSCEAGNLTSGHYELRISDPSFYGGDVLAEFDLRK